MSTEYNHHKPVAIYTDVGGTFTDTLLLDEEGAFHIGKAATTMPNLDSGYFESFTPRLLH